MSEAVGPWHRSSFSYSNGECVEFAELADGTVGVRDSKDAEGPILRFTRSEIDAFVRGILEGEFDSFR